MATVEHAIVDRLKANAAVNALVSTRIAPWEQTQSMPLPHISYLRVSTNREHIMAGSAGFAHAMIQVDCWAATYSAAKDLAEAVRKTLDGYHGTTQGHYIGVIQNTIDRDVPQRLSTGSERSLFRVMQEYRVSFRETAAIVN